MAVFDPTKTTIDLDGMKDFLMGELTGKLTDVPGIGPSNASKLRAASINNSYQLIGHFLMCKESDDVVKHMDGFAEFLKDLGRNNICMALAEKTETYMHGIYDRSAYSADGGDVPAEEGGCTVM